MIDKRLEEKLGFSRVRAAISDRCSTDYAAGRVAEEEFSSDGKEIQERLSRTDEMRLILMFEENFPTSGYIDCIGFLEAIGNDASIDQLSLGKLRTLLDSLRKIHHFFRGIKDGIYPSLKRFSSRIADFPEVQSRIDLILDKTGEVRDSASPELQEIRRSLKDKESLVAYTAEDLSDILGIMPEDYTEALFLMGSDSLSGREVIAVRAKDSAGLQKAKKAMENYLAQRKEETRNYLPDAFKLQSDARVETKNLTAVLFIGPNAVEESRAFLAGE